MEAIIYARWSSLEQSGTTSAPRQAEINEGFAHRMGWKIVDCKTDEGRSAWTGDNIRNGELGKLIERFEREGAAGKVLVVEKLDRLSRQPALTMAAWVQRACATGLTICTSDGRHTIDAHRLSHDQFTVMSLIFDAFRGYDESQTKSGRVGDAWSEKRKLGLPMTVRCPGWLTIDPALTKYKARPSDAAYLVIQDRADVVRRIFKMTEAGIGKSAIARTFNVEGVPVFGNGDGWHASYIQKILRNRAVIGEYQPHKAPKGKDRTPVGDPIKGYFPAIIPADQFDRVNDAKASKVLAQQSGYNRLGNLLSGLARCWHCGATMTYVNKGEGWTYLKCSAAHRGAGRCDHRKAYNYGVIQNAILDELLHLAMDDQHFTAPDTAIPLEAEVNRLKRELKDTESSLRVAYREMENDPEDEFAQEMYRMHKGEAKALKAALTKAQEALAVARGSVSPAEHIARVAEVRAMIDDADEDRRYQARAKVKLALNDLIEVVRFGDKPDRIAVGLVNNVSHLFFTSDGSKALELDFGSYKTPGENQAVDDYLRRRSA